MEMEHLYGVFWMFNRVSPPEVMPAFGLADMMDKWFGRHLRVAGSRNE